MDRTSFSSMNCLLEWAEGGVEPSEEEWREMPSTSMLLTHREKAKTVKMASTALDIMIKRKSPLNWKDTIIEFAQIRCNNNIWSNFRRLVFGAAVYYICEKSRADMRYKAAQSQWNGKERLE
ncbi:hypothetical protein Tco_0317631 [Tanacetum coccineum]